MHSFKGHATAIILLSGFAFLGMSGVGTAPERVSQITPEQFVRALSAHQTEIVDLFLKQKKDLNARVRQDRPVLVSAILMGQTRVAQELIAAGACVDLADENGVTPLMAASLSGDVELVQQLLPLATNPTAKDRKGQTALHYAISAASASVAEILLPTMPDLAAPMKDGRTAITMALEQENPTLADLIVDHLSGDEDWNTDTLHLLQAALAGGHKDRVRALMAKHASPPVPEGRRVPLLAYSIATNDMGACRMLLECGADPNTVLPDKCDDDFLALLPPKLRNYIDGDKGVTVLTLAAGLGQCESLNALLQAGADKNRATTRYKMLPLYVAAETGKWQCTQILLGGGPSPEQLRIEITLASQHAAVIKDGVSVFETICSTGRDGYSTRTGDFVITDKDKNHRSTIYKVDMPYFMRLSCLDFGMHEGVVPRYPASHGCIRLPGEAAKKLFAEIPVGTLVTVK